MAAGHLSVDCPGAQRIPAYRRSRWFETASTQAFVCPAMCARDEGWQDCQVGDEEGAGTFSPGAEVAGLVTGDFWVVLRIFASIEHSVVPDDTHGAPTCVGADRWG
jgi:hypothetical protein